MTPLPQTLTFGPAKNGGRSTLKTLSAATLLTVVLAACGGSGGGVTAPSPTPPPPSSAFPPSQQFEQQCAANTGTLQFERQWVRSYVDEAYLWYSEVPNLNPVTSTEMPQTFLLSLTRNGLPANKDRFTFSYGTAAWNDLINSGVSAGYGTEWALLSRTPPRQLRVAYTNPNTPAATAGLARGATVLKVNGVDINDNTTTGINTLNAGLFPSALGVTSTFEVMDLGATVARTVSMTSASVTSRPVLDVRWGNIGGVIFGYILFNDHLASAETQLIDAVNQLKAAGAQEVILDLRYNGGGYLYIASQLGYMLSTQALAGRVFEKLQYNNKRTADNNKTPELFLNRSTTGAALPQLGLGRVYVLTTGSTCSASESIMNGLRPFVSIIQIGSTTCGKPYGFTAKENCGTSYFPIEFEGVNSAGQGGYSNGFTPGGTFQGCSSSDDFDHALGDSAEKMLGTAISHRLTGACPTVAIGKESVSPSGAVLLRHPAREGKYLK
ncbi:MAG: S41 family peptidase [Burkholderiales bacterium]